MKSGSKKGLQLLGHLAEAAFLLGLLGCANPGGGGGASTGGGGNTPADYIYLPKNWSFTATPTHGGSTAPYIVAGVIDEQPGSSSSHYVTSVLQINAPCFAGATIVPSDGSVTATRIQTSSFDVDGQVFSLDAQKNSTATQLTGTYAIAGGCANGEAGNISGQSYAALSGNYFGALSGQPARSISLNLTQESLGTGVGTFVVSGTATFSGFSCFTQGTLTDSYVRGGSVVLLITANDGQGMQPGSQVMLNGTMDTAAQTLTVTSANIASGSCAGSLGSITFTKQ